MNQVDREELLAQLENVAPGLNARDIVEQSSCVVFKNKRVFTYNDEVACSYKCDVGDIEGAVQARPLIDVLHKISDEKLMLDTEEGSLIIKGKRKEVRIRMESEILLGIDVVDVPKKKDEWLDIPEGFSQAVDLVRQSASTDESHFSLTCVHVAPKWIEACDNFQITRYAMDTGLDKSILVRHEAMKEVGRAVMYEWAITESWIHFRNKKGLTLSCRQYAEDFPPMDKVLDVSGDPVKLPKALTEMAERAEVFSREEEHNEVKVDMRPKRIRITGDGPNGSYTETRPTSYKGRALEFMISPKLLSDITNRFNKCEVSEKALKVDNGSYVFVTYLGVIEDE